MFEGSFISRVTVDNVDFLSPTGSYTTFTNLSRFREFDHERTMAQAEMRRVRPQTGPCGLSMRRRIDFDEFEFEFVPGQQQSQFVVEFGAVGFRIFFDRIDGVFLGFSSEPVCAFWMTYPVSSAIRTLNR